MSINSTSSYEQGIIFGFIIYFTIRPYLLVEGLGLSCGTIPLLHSSFLSRPAAAALPAWKVIIARLNQFRSLLQSPYSWTACWDSGPSSTAWTSSSQVAVGFKFVNWEMSKKKGSTTWGWDRSMVVAREGRAVGTGIFDLGRNDCD